MFFRARSDPARKLHHREALLSPSLCVEFLLLLSLTLVLSIPPARADIPPLVDLSGPTVTLTRLGIVVTITSVAVLHYYYPLLRFILPCTLEGLSGIEPDLIHQENPLCSFCV